MPQGALHDWKAQTRTVVTPCTFCLLVKGRPLLSEMVAMLSGFSSVSEVHTEPLLDSGSGHWMPINLSVCWELCKH